MRQRNSSVRRQHPALTLGALFLGAFLLLPSAWAAVDRDQAGAMAQRVTPGRVLAVERGLYVDGSVVWKVRVLTAGGDVRLVVLDADTGRTR